MCLIIALVWVKQFLTFLHLNWIEKGVNVLILLGTRVLIAEDATLEYSIGKGIHVDCHWSIGVNLYFLK